MLRSRVHAEGWSACPVLPPQPMTTWSKLARGSLGTSLLCEHHGGGQLSPSQCKPAGGLLPSHRDFPRGPMTGPFSSGGVDVPPLFWEKPHTLSLAHTRHHLSAKGNGSALRLLPSVSLAWLFFYTLVLPCVYTRLLGQGLKFFLIFLSYFCPERNKTNTSSKPISCFKHALAPKSFRLSGPQVGNGRQHVP